MKSEGVRGGVFFPPCFASISPVVSSTLVPQTFASEVSPAWTPLLFLSTLPCLVTSHYPAELSPKSLPKEAFSCTPEDTKFSSHLITAPKLLHCAEHTYAAMCKELHAFFPSRLWA